MTKIQVLLIAAIVAGAWAASRALGAKLVYRLGLLGLMATGVVFVAMPDLTTAIAAYLGVGRGTDLLLYVSIMTGSYAILLVYRRTRHLEQKLTEHVRATAIQHAKQDLP